MLTEELVRALITVGFGAVAGGLTNTIAIWMLFHPYEPPKLFGRWSVRFLQGAIPKNQPRLASAIGRTVGSRLLTEDDLTRTFADGEFRDAFDQRLALFVNEMLNTERGSLEELIPASAIGDLEALIADGLQRGLEQLEAYIASDAFEAAMRRRAGDFVEAIAHEPIAGMLTPARGAALEGAVEGWLQNAVESADFTEAVSDYLDRAAGKLLSHGRTFEEVLPLGLISSLEKAIASYLPLAAARLGGLLEDPKARARFETMLHDLLHRFLRDLKFHQRVVARLVMTEDTVEKVLDTIEAEGADRLSEILRDPAVQEAMARGVNQAIVDFLRRPVHEVLGEPDDPNLIEARDTLAGWVVGMARDPATREFLGEKLHAGLEKAGAKTWGDVLERVPTDRIADALIFAARTDAARKVIDTGAQRVATRLLQRPIGTPARWFPPDGPRRIEAALGDPIWDWLQTQVPAVVERIDVARRVEDKVLHFPMEKMEEIVRRVTDRELRLIVRLGYLLGAFIGLGLVAVDRLLG
ncbi:MAG: DUF445 family protein [Gemmatimonadetes bacterium]|nr:DUF445 family protein [Gemmatimonadota bacterium]MDA1104159.1 DUF445 family protein [Gemmatimonadota bacterium]